MWKRSVWDLYPFWIALALILHTLLLSKCAHSAMRAARAPPCGAGAAAAALAFGGGDLAFAFALAFAGPTCVETVRGEAAVATAADATCVDTALAFGTHSFWRPEEEAREEVATAAGADAFEAVVP